jgi:DNA-directed RNA polymerase specialized sigma24 family protein
MTGRRSPFYGQLQTASLPSEVKAIWYSRDEELEPLPSWRWSFDHQTDLEAVEQRDLLEKILESAGMNEREEIVLRMLTIEGYTLEEIGQVLGVTKERVRQMEIRILRKLRKAQWRYTGIPPWEVHSDIIHWQYYRREQERARREAKA